MSKTSQWVTAAFFCLFLALFGLAHLLLPDRAFSPVENRNLKQLPEFTWSALTDGSYTAALEKYLADQFPLRDGWMGLKTRYEALLGKREFHGVYLCGDTLISQVEDAGRAEKNLAFVRALVEKTDRPVYLGLIPTAAAVWRQKLPAGAPSFDQRAYLERAEAAGARWVDVAGALTAHAGEPLYYRTDHHWTSLGAYYGYTALLEALGEEPPPLGEPETVSRDFNGTLYSTSGVHWLEPDAIQRYVDGSGVTVEDVYGGETHGLYVDRFLGEKDQYASFLGGNAPLYIVRNPAAPARKLLVVRDSYSDALAPFLSQHFSEIHLLDLRYYKTSVAQYAEDNAVDLIFICYSVENFVKDVDVAYLGQ
ncbi:MAG: hypothetical protein K2P20_07015 [Oscillospiraceae bacterium]|nr:hypothetical protein [Oscillospiraceae bacterium]